MKILIIVTSANKRTSFVKKTYNEQEIGIATALCKKNIKCDIAYYSGNQEGTTDIPCGDNSIKIYLFKGIDFLRTSFFKDYSHIYAQYDILMPISYDHYETMHIARRYPDKTIVYHGTYFSKFNKKYNLKCKILDPFLVPVYRKNSTYFITKNRLAESFLNNKGIRNTHVIGVGIDKEQLHSRDMLESIFSLQLQELKNKGYKILLYIGRIEPRRNIKFLIELINNLSPKDNIKLVLIGDGKAKYKEECLKLIENYHLQSNVIHFSQIEQKYLPLIYSMADVFLLPTSYEIFGMVLLEAMYFGVPVITTYNGGSDLLINDTQNGFLIEELCIETWSKQILNIISSEAVDNEKLINAAHETIKYNYTWDSLIDKFIDVYNKKLSTLY